MHKHGSLLLRPLLLLQSVLKGFWDHQEMAVPDASFRDGRAPSHATPQMIPADAPLLISVDIGGYRPPLLSVGFLLLMYFSAHSAWQRTSWLPLKTEATMSFHCHD